MPDKEHKKSIIIEFNIYLYKIYIKVKLKVLVIICGISLFF